MKIRIKGFDPATKDCMFFLDMSDEGFAFAAFENITRDPIHQDLNWELIINGEIVHWHYPVKSVLR